MTSIGLLVDVEYLGVIPDPFLAFKHVLSLLPMFFLLADLSLLDLVFVLFL